MAQAGSFDDGAWRWARGANIDADTWHLSMDGVRALCGRVVDPDEQNEVGTFVPVRRCPPCGARAKQNLGL